MRSAPTMKPVFDGSNNMIEYNGRKFAESEREVTESLFHMGGTVTGKARRYSRKIEFYRLNGEHVASLNREGVLARVSLLPDGRKWYNYGTPELTGEIESLSEHREAVERLAVRREFDLKRGATVFWFK